MLLSQIMSACGTTMSPKMVLMMALGVALLRWTKPATARFIWFEDGMRDSRPAARVGYRGKDGMKTMSERIFAEYRF